MTVSAAIWLLLGLAAVQGIAIYLLWDRVKSNTDNIDGCYAWLQVIEDRQNDLGDEDELFGGWGQRR